MHNVLIYSPDFDGHRQVYVYVIAHLLKEKGYNIIVAGNFEAILKNSFYIDIINKDEQIIKVDTSGYPKYGLNISNSEFFDLQTKYETDITVFTEADNHESLFTSQLYRGNKRFKGKIVAIFLRPWYFYHKQNFVETIIYLKNLRITWKYDSRFFHEFLNRFLKLIDCSLFIDDFYTLHHPKSIWLPDVFQQYADQLVLEEKIEQRIWIDRLTRFRIENQDRFILLYFGSSQQRRGYDELLKLAVEQNACFVHCGLIADTEKYTHNTDEFRRILKERNMLFETNEFIIDPYCIEHFFKSTDYMVMPYNNFLSSSGVMLQALGYGIPVLVPDYGLMGYRVRKFKLGMTYKPNELSEKFQKFIATPKSEYTNSISEYMNSQSAEKLKSVLLKTFSAV